MIILPVLLIGHGSKIRKSIFISTALNGLFLLSHFINYFHAKGFVEGKEKLSLQDFWIICD